MAKPNTKSNFIQSLLIMSVIFLGLQLFLPNLGKNTAIQYNGKTLATPDQALAELRTANLNILDQDAGRLLLPALEKLLKTSVDAKKITQTEADATDIEGKVLVADTQLKAGLIRNETARVRAAYQTLADLEYKRFDKPEWNKEIALPRKATDSERFAWSSTSGHELYARTVEELSNRNQGDLIWGLIPGGYQFIDFLVHITGAQPAFSYAFAAFLLALVVRAVVFPLTKKQLMFGRQMSQLTPLTNEIKSKYKDDPTAMNAKVMELYKEYGINPMAGCGPAMLQMPLFFTVYQCMLHYQFTFQKGVFLWMNPITSKATNGFAAPNLGQRDLALIIIYGVTMVISTLLTPITDPSQVKQQRLMGIGISVFFTFTMFTGAFPVPAAFVLYWTFTNLLAMSQSLWSYRQPLPPLQKVNAPGGGVYPQGGASSKWMAKLEEMQRVADAQKSGGKPSGGAPLNGSILSPGETKTGTPAKHKPKKRK